MKTPKGKDNMETVRVFKCPCEGNKYKLAGRPNDSPTLKEKREIGELIAVGCSVIYMTIDEFRQQKWQWCEKHFD